MKCICFECHKALPQYGEHLEYYILVQRPIFCSEKCAVNFPDHNTDGFKESMLKLKNLYCQEISKQVNKKD